MNRINLGAAGASQVSRALPAAEPKADLVPASLEASPSEAPVELFRDEFVGGPSRSAGAPAAQALSAPAAQQQGGGATNSVVDSIKDFIRGIFGGGNDHPAQGIGPVAQSPGKDHLAQGGPGSNSGGTMFA
jgi:hypothetical protein